MRLQCHTVLGESGVSIFFLSMLFSLIFFLASFFCQESERRSVGLEGAAPFGQEVAALLHVRQQPDRQTAGLPRVHAQEDGRQREPVQTVTLEFNIGLNHGTILATKRPP